jgi:hypothetical protein
MALRLILVGVVASLALDLPRGDVRPVATAAYRSVMVAEPSRPLPPENTATLVADEPTILKAGDVLAAEATIKPAVTVAPIRPTLMVDETLPVLTPAAPVLAPSPLPVELALVPLPDATPAPILMPAPPTPDAATAPAPVAELIPGPAPIPTIAAVDPMTPPAPVALEMSPEAAPAPPAAVAETAKAAPTDPDAGFRKVVASMASAFAADMPAATPVSEPKPLLAKVEAAPVAVPAPAQAAEDVAGADLDLYPGVAFALNREAEGVAPIEASARAEPAPAMAPVAEATTDPSRAERLSQAVKLTGQAVNAWAGLLSQRPSASAIQR